MAKRKDRPTLATVASRAGVSIKTASRVLNGEKHVASSTAAKVEAAARELGFRLNSTARRLRAGAHSPYIGVVMGDAADPAQAELFAHVEARLAHLGLRPIVGVTGGDVARESAFVEECLSSDAAGICVIRTQPGMHATYRHAAVTVVSCDAELAGVGVRTVVDDDFQAGALAARQLISHGHVSCGILGDHADLARTRTRLEGARAEFAKHPEVGWRAFLHEGAHDRVTAKNAVAALLGSRTAPSALITLSTTTTMGAVDASRRLDQWPALVGIDDFPGADLLDISVVTADLSLLAAEASRTFDPELSSAHATNPGDPSETVTIPVRLIARGSGEESPDRRTR